MELTQDTNSLRESEECAGHQDGFLGPSRQEKEDAGLERCADGWTLLGAWIFNMSPSSGCCLEHCQGAMARFAPRYRVRVLREAGGRKVYHKDLLTRGISRYEKG